VAEIDMASNIPEFSVTELSLALRRNIEEGFARVRVRGELSKVKIHTSGHLYSDLKDADCLINIVCWRAQVAKLPIRPEEGLEVICTGKITTYPARSNYQMVVETIELAGEGALLKILEDRRKKLMAEGLFDETRKKSIPFAPSIIGVVTSPTGAVIKDILHRVEDRFPCHVILWPVKVQGDGAAHEISAAIDGFNAIHDHKPDVLIVGRGGGSFEDLMAFNEENVVRAIARSDIPIISAVGHETDISLSDYVADARAPTPTAAAEMATPSRLAVLNALQSSSDHLRQSAQIFMQARAQTLSRAVQLLGDPASWILQKSQRLDHIADQIKFLAGGFLDRLAIRIGKLSIPQPQHFIAMLKERIINISTRQLYLKTSSLERKANDLNGLARMLDMLSHKRVLERGYALIRDENGAVISTASSTKTGQNVVISFQDGQKNAEIK
jgi:exodeoxyribonuclease VII large subunit